MAEIVEKPKAFSATAQEVAKRVLRHENAVLIMILGGIMAVMAVISKGTSISAGNLRNILVQSSTRGLAAIGELFVLLTAGIDLSVGGIALMSSLLSMRDKPRCPGYLCASGKIVAVAQITWSNSLVELFGGRQGDTGKKNSGW